MEKFPKKEEIACRLCRPFRVLREAGSCTLATSTRVQNSLLERESMRLIKEWICV